MPGGLLGAEAGQECGCVQVRRRPCGPPGPRGPSPAWQKLPGLSHQSFPGPRRPPQVLRRWGAPPPTSSQVVDLLPCSEAGVPSPRHRDLEAGSSGSSSCPDRRAPDVSPPVDCAGAHPPHTAQPSPRPFPPPPTPSENGGCVQGAHQGCSPCPPVPTQSNSPGEGGSRKLSRSLVYFSLFCRDHLVVV